MEIGTPAPLPPAARPAQDQAVEDQEVVRQHTSTHPEVKDFAAVAFVMGYSLHADALTERAKSCCEASLDFADTYKMHPDIVSHTQAKGELEGLYAKIFQRRDRLWHRNDIKVRTWSRKFGARVDRHALITAAKTAYTSVGEAETSAQQRRDAIRTALIAFLLAQLAEYENLTTEAHNFVAQAQAEGGSEGKAVAAALVAYLRSKPAPDMASVYSDSLAQLQNAKTYMTGVDQIVTTLVAGLAGDLAQTLPPLIAAGMDDQALQDATSGDLNNGDGPAFYLEAAIQAALILGLLAVYQAEGVHLFDWLTMGDDKVCPQCLGYEAGGPYTSDELPGGPPAHGGCRCVLAPAS